MKEGNKKTIDQLIAEALLEYGEANREVIVWYLERVYGIKLEEADIKSRLFVKALRDMFGAFEKYVEDAICERIADEYGIEYGGQGFVKLMLELQNVT